MNCRSSPLLCDLVNGDPYELRPLLCDLVNIGDLYELLLKASASDFINIGDLYELLLKASACDLINIGDLKGWCCEHQGGPGDIPNERVPP